MAKKTNVKRAARVEKNNRNMNRALELLTAGFLAEFYLLLINNYFVRGTVDQLVAVSYLLEGLVYAGLVLVAAGIVLLIVGKKKDKDFTKLTKWLLIAGVFFTLSSELMLKIYPQGTTAMCIFVPIVMILGVIFLMYQREFSVQTVALAMSILAMVLLSRGGGNWSIVVKGYSICAAAAVAILLVVVCVAQRSDGCVGSVRIFPSGTGYKMIYLVLAICLAAIVAALFVSGVAYYGVWALSVLLFILAVYYTVKML